MAGDWIKVEHTTPDKPEVVQLADVLGIDQDAVVGKLLRFWIWADQQSVDGDALRVTKTFLDRLVNCSGFSDALLEVGWLIARSGSFSVPHFARHNGQTAKSRALTKSRMKRSRDARSVTQSSPEKRREENNIKPPYPPKGGTASPGISRDGLSDPDKLRRWCARTGKRLGLTPADLTWIVAAADKALEVGDDPVGLFLFLAGEVAAGRTDKIGDDRYDAAKRKLRDRSIAEDLADAKGVDFDE